MINYRRGVGVCKIYVHLPSEVANEIATMMQRQPMNKGNNRVTSLVWSAVPPYHYCQLMAGGNNAWCTRDANGTRPASSRSWLDACSSSSSSSYIIILFQTDSTVTTVAGHPTLAAVDILYICVIIVITAMIIASVFTNISGYRSDDIQLHVDEQLCCSACR